MSLSPAAEDGVAGSGPGSEFRRNLDALNRLLDAGGSFSGRERNCAFLNLGRGSGGGGAGVDPNRSGDLDADADAVLDSRGRGAVSFATVSAVSGLDFPDDGRALALTDWDGDGDLDLWQTARTAPRLRFLRNDSAAPGAGAIRALALRLRGTTARVNRDAIGARVEVFLRGVEPGPGQRRVVTLRAGEGYLGQSSKELHFGLGAVGVSGVERVEVRWPGGGVETFRGLEAGRRYLLVEGAAEPRPIGAHAPPRTRLAAAPLDLAVDSGRAQVLLSGRVPLPALPFTAADGSERQVDDLVGKPVWLNLWASWCAPCRGELREFSRRGDELARAGLRLLPLTVDGLAAPGPGAAPTTTEDARKLLARDGLPFVADAASAEAVRRLQLVHDILFAQNRPLPVPASFLLDARGRLAAVYRGVVGVDRVLADLGKLQLDEAELVRAALPFTRAGIWYDGRRRLAPLGLAADLLGRGFVADAADYLLKHRGDLAGQKGYPRLAAAAGDDLAARGRLPEALQLYRDALAADPRNVAVLNNLAWHLATHPDPGVRDGAEAVRWAARAADLTGGRHPAILDTLAAALARSGDFPRALQTVDRALQIARGGGDNARGEKLLAARRRYAAGKPTTAGEGK